ncbi:hypothetical protein [Dictyobacter kobayashii]|nr:hypothetical protein [Dictyobacter kobayashii]
MLHTVGTYLHRMHAIKFAYPGYLFGDGPTAAPAEDACNISPGRSVLAAWLYSSGFESTRPN